MPELPEVSALAAGLSQRMRGHRVAAVRLRSMSALKTYDPPLAALAGAEVTGWSRHGKFLEMRAGQLSLVVHLARAGWVHWRERVSRSKPSLRGPLALQVELDDGSGVDVTEQGTEKRLSLYVVREVSDVPGIARLGPDVLDPALDVAALAGILAARSGQLKSVIADQELIAGVGNAYSDEVLHAARLSPFKRASTLTSDDVARLHAALRGVIGGAVERAATSDIATLKPDKKGSLRIHDHTGDPCPVCGDRIREVSLAARSFQYCPTCQTGGRVLADRRLSRLRIDAR
ncbi:MAG: Fpg/Nei family DNA glycosylase [Candidatus Dormibacteria bacterium]